jgi:hypothetical protein
MALTHGYGKFPLLIIGIGTVVFACNPMHAAVLFQFNYVDRASDGSAGVVGLSKVSQSQGEQGTASPPQFQQSLVVGHISFGAFCSVGASRTEVCDDGRLPSGAHSSSICLATGPTPCINDSRGDKNPYGISLGGIESYEHYASSQYALNGFCEEATEQHSFALFCTRKQVAGVPFVLSAELLSHRASPLGGNVVNAGDDAGGAGLGVNDVGDDTSGVPLGHGITNTTTLVSDIVDAGEYDLVVECHNLALRVVWFEQATGAVGSHTIGSNHQFVVRQVQDDDRAVHGADLGNCTVWGQDYEQDKQIFPHVILSSGDSAIAGFTSGSDNLHTCLGCTLLVSDDGRDWHEITAVQAVPLSSKRDRSIQPPSPE